MGESPQGAGRSWPSPPGQCPGSVCPGEATRALGTPWCPLWGGAGGLDPKALDPVGVGPWLWGNGEQHSPWKLGETQQNHCARQEVSSMGCCDGTWMSRHILPRSHPHLTGHRL